MTKQIKSVSVIGDSLLKGIIFDYNKNCYVVSHNSCVDKTQQELNFPVNNYSLCGLNSRNINKYVDLVLKQTKDEFIVLEFGFDDLEKKSIFRFNNSLRKVIKKLTKQNKEIILVTLPLNQILMNKNCKTIVKYNQIIRKISKKQNTCLLDLENNFLLKDTYPEEKEAILIKDYVINKINQSSRYVF